MYNKSENKLGFSRGDYNENFDIKWLSKKKW